MIDEKKIWKLEIYGNVKIGFFQNKNCLIWISNRFVFNLKKMKLFINMTDIIFGVKTKDEPSYSNTVVGDHMNKINTSFIFKFWLSTSFVWIKSSHAIKEKLF